MKFKIGDKVKAKRYPFLLNLKIVNIIKDPFPWSSERYLYITKSGGQWFAEELELI